MRLIFAGNWVDLAAWLAGWRPNVTRKKRCDLKCLVNEVLTKIVPAALHFTN